jgi:hypothetical protein
MVIGQHGSWNRSTLSGYKVVFVPFANGRPSGPPRDILSGFLAPDERESYGRPVGVTLGSDLAVGRRPESLHLECGGGGDAESRRLMNTGEGQAEQHFAIYGKVLVIELRVF